MKVVFLPVIFFSLPLFLFAENIPVCPSNVGARTALDGFCPRLEGAHLPDCCPPVQGPTLNCTYGIEDTYSSYSKRTGGDTCQGGAGGTTVFIPECCNVDVINCKKADYIELDFISRPIKRPYGTPEVKQCCFEGVCPLKNYWMNGRSSLQGGRVGQLKAKASNPHFERILRPVPICQPSNPAVCGNLPVCSSLTGACPPIVVDTPTGTSSGSGNNTGGGNGANGGSSNGNSSTGDTPSDPGTGNNGGSSTGDSPSKYDQVDFD